MNLPADDGVRIIFKGKQHHKLMMFANDTLVKLTWLDVWLY